MKSIMWLLLPIFAFVMAQADDDHWSMTGTVTNTTDPNHAISASARVTYDGKGCVILVNAPLQGSGVCGLSKALDAQNKLAIQTEGPGGNITFDGSLNGSVFSGAYTVDFPNCKQLVQKGTFEFREDVCTRRRKNRPRSGA